MAQVDFSGIVYLLPVFSFLIVWIIVYAVLVKTKIIEDKWVQIFVAFVFATVFVSATGARTYILQVTVWFAIMLVCLFFILLVLGLAGKQVEFLHKGIGVIFVIATIIIFVISAIFVFSDYFSPYLPWNNGFGANTDVLHIAQWFFSDRVFGAVILLVISAIVSLILVRSGAKG